MTTQHPAFRFVALASERFADLWALGDAELRARGICRMIADERPGFPCRVSLVDAEVGESVLLIPFTHHDVTSPYRGSGPMFVRRHAVTANPEIGRVPEMFRHRLLSVRAYDSGSMMCAAEVVKGTQLEDVIGRQLANPDAAYLHLHNAGPGCYNCAVVRA